MDTKEQEFVKAVRENIQHGHTQAPAFCAANGFEVVEFLHTLMYTAQAVQTVQEAMHDVGAIKWCFEQLGDDDGTDSEGGNQ